VSDRAWQRYAKAPLAVRAAVALTITLAFLAIPAFGDQWAYAHLYQAKLYDHDWAMALRACGTLYIWIPVALIFWLVQREHDPAAAKRRALLVLGAPVIAGLLCEVLKLLIRRERPDVDHGHWVFRAWSDHPFSSAGLSTPSSHTIVAFGAATMLARMYPRARWVFYVMAAGCAVTRVMAHAHYLSDVTFGALLGWAVGWGVWMQWGVKAEDR
jgi:membrane-associated phospholipid phosphatase